MAIGGTPGKAVPDTPLSRIRAAVFVSTTVAVPRAGHVPNRLWSLNGNVLGNYPRASAVSGHRGALLSVTSQQGQSLGKGAGWCQRRSHFTTCPRAAQR